MTQDFTVFLSSGLLSMITPSTVLLFILTLALPIVAYKKNWMLPIYLNFGTMFGIYIFLVFAGNLQLPVYMINNPPAGPALVRIGLEYGSVGVMMYALGAIIIQLTLSIIVSYLLKKHYLLFNSGLNKTKKKR